MKCRFCNNHAMHSFANLGISPLSNALIKHENLTSKETLYPLHAFVCEKCFLVQLEEFESPSNIFTDYPYFSSHSDSWLTHCKQFTEMVVNKFSINSKSLVVEIASNDGYLLQYFNAKNIPTLGIEPAKNVAELAVQRGISTISEFFGYQLAARLCDEGKSADLLIGNNVLAHVPDLNDFVRGLQTLLKPKGIIVMEFPHLLNLIIETQFDTIYHEHFSYFSFLTVAEVFNRHQLTIFDVEHLKTHGGSLRIYAAHIAEGRKKSAAIGSLRELEKKFGLNNIATYYSFNNKILQIKSGLLDLLVSLKRQGKHIAAYGAAAKGNTLLNYCGIKNDFIDFVSDRNPHKQGRYLPGSRIPIMPPEYISEMKPEYILVLPWNIKEEIFEQLSFVRNWGGKFIIPIPKIEIL